MLHTDDERSFLNEIPHFVRNDIGEAINRGEKECDRREAVALFLAHTLHKNFVIPNGT